MLAVYPRARVRLSAVAVALSLSSTTFVLGFPATSAHAAAPSSALTSNDAVKTPAPPALSTASFLAPRAVKTAATPHASARKPVQIAGQKLAREKAAARKAAAHRVALRKAAARKAAAHKAALHKAKLAKAAHAAAVRRTAFGKRVIRAAAKYRGTPYRYGATGPSRFDCSGFTRFVFAKFGISPAAQLLRPVLRRTPHRQQPEADR